MKRIKGLGRGGERTLRLLWRPYSIVIPDVRNARKPSVFGCGPYDPGPNPPRRLENSGSRIANFSGQINDLEKSRVRDDRLRS